MTALAALDDRALSDLLARGDRQALGLLYERYAGLVFGVALRVLKDRADAEELVQETFLEAWRRATQYEPARATPAGWLITIARSRAIDRARSRATSERTAELPEAVPPAETPDVVVELGRQKAVIARAVATLPLEQRRVLELAWNEGLSQSDIAARTGMPLGTVKTRTRAALLEVGRVVKQHLQP
jgi:RNA polymerase sigma-70 factor (ECF subfamily)